MSIKQKSKKNSIRRTKRKSSERKITERKSSVKKTWEKFVQKSDSRLLLKDAWKIDKDKLKEYSEKINKLHRKYST